MQQIGYKSWNFSLHLFWKTTRHFNIAARRQTARLAEFKPKPTEKADKEILSLSLSLSHSPSFHAKAADAAPSSPPSAWLTEPAMAVLWLQTSPHPPLQGWERGQVSTRQDMLHQQRPWHSCRPGFYSAGVVWGCLDRRGALGYISSLLLEPAYLWVLGVVGGVCGLCQSGCISNGRGHRQVDVLSALGEEQCVPKWGGEQPQLSSDCCCLKSSPTAPPAGLASSFHNV